jgi:hypothetical protein
LKTEREEALGAHQRPDGRDKCFELVFGERGPRDRSGPVDVSDGISVTVSKGPSLCIEVSSDLYEASFTAHVQSATSFGLANLPDVHGSKAEFVVPEHALPSDLEMPFVVVLVHLDVGRSVKGASLSEPFRNGLHRLKELLKHDSSGIPVDRMDPRLVRLRKKAGTFGAFWDK